MRNRNLWTGIFVAALSLVLLIGCTGIQTAPPADMTDTADTTAAGGQKIDESGGPAGGPLDQANPGWKIDLKGVRNDTVTAASFEEAKVHGTHYQKISFERKGELTEYRAMPFRYVAAMVDGQDDEHPWLFDAEAWDQGYDVTLTAADGYAVTFSTADIPADALYVADEKNGEFCLPRIVGDVPGNIQVKDLAAIELALNAGAAAEQVRLELDINGETTVFSREELEMSPYYIEAAGSYTTSAGTTHTHLYGGIRFADFLRSYVDLKPETTVKVTAMDGYTMSYSGGDLMDESEGTWILAFRSDGEYLPLDPGYFRSVKVGPSEPNIDGHSSARMIKRIEVSAEVYREYELLITGKMDNRLDRQTIQSGVSCHTRTVEYFDRKSGETETYTGIPLWLLLAYGDDPQHAPHRQTDKSILSYKEETARQGYAVEILASDGFSIELDSKQINKNDDVIIATQKNGETLPDREWPLIIVWDQNAEVVPEGIKPVRSITEIHLLFD